MKKINDLKGIVDKINRNKQIVRQSLKNILLLMVLLSSILVVAVNSGISVRFIIHSGNKGFKDYGITTLLFFLVSMAVLAILHEQVRRKAVLNNYRESEEKYKKVVDNIGEVLFQTDKEGNWVLLNPAWTDITGFSLEESLGKRFIDFVYIWDKQKNLDTLGPLIKGEQEQCKYEVRYMRKDGGTCWMEGNVRINYDSKGNATGSSGILKDITQSKLIELELNKKDKLLNGIAQSANILLHTTNYETALNEALEILGKVTNVDLVYVFKNEEDFKSGEKYLDTKAFWSRHNIKFTGPEGKDTKRSWDLVGISRWYETFCLGDIFSSIIRKLPENEQAYFKNFGVLSILIMPIFIDGKFWGIIGLENHTEEHEWTGVEKNILMVAAGNIGGLFKRIQAEEALKKAMQADFKQIVQNLQNLVFKIVRMNEGEFGFSLIEGKYGQKIGLNTNNVQGKSFKEIFNERVASCLSENCEKGFGGNITNLELVVARTTFYVTLTPIYKQNEVIELVGSAIDITSQKKAEDRIRSLAYYDSLTGLPNRSLFSEELKKYIKEFDEKQNKLAILFLDFDRFKVINDTLGHATGDLLLKEISERLKEKCSKNAIVSRMGGDEFIILLHSIDKLSEVEDTAQTILKSFEKPLVVGQHELFITASIGISLYPQSGNEPEALIKNADTAMYRAKSKGGNNYEFYETKMNEKALDRLELENDLRKVLDRNELFVFYQPKVDLSSGKISGAEALVRWKHSTRGIVSPVDFIPLAEETGLILPIGEWVLNDTCRQIRFWNEMGFNDVKISVNISPQQFLRGNLVSVVDTAITKAGIAGSQLELEITESCLMENSERNMEIVKRLKLLGVDVSVDDFGKGFSSLSYLKQFDVDVLKIDSSFVKDIPSDLNDMAITTAIISMAHELNLKVVAEGVETKEQLDFLLSKSCDEIQGYYFSKPISNSEFEIMLKDKKKLYKENIYIENTTVV